MPPSMARDASGRPTDLSATGSMGPEDMMPSPVAPVPAVPMPAAPPAAAKPRVGDSTLDAPGRRAPLPPTSGGISTKPFAHVGGSRPILEVRLTGAGFDIAVTDTGAHELGRSSEADLRVNHPTVSRKQARIIIGDDRTIAYLQDAGGANGTRLNGTASWLTGHLVYTIR